MNSFTIQELKDLYQALNMSIDWHSELDVPNKLNRLYKLQDKINKMIKKGKAKKPKIFDEWFDMVHPDSEQGASDAFEIWSEEECDECYEFLKKLLNIKQIGNEE